MSVVVVPDRLQREGQTLSAWRGGQELWSFTGVLTAGPENAFVTGQLVVATKPPAGAEHSVRGWQLPRAVSTYAGAWLRGTPNDPSGFYRFVDGSEYVGGVLDGRRHGRGSWARGVGRVVGTWAGDAIVDARCGFGGSGGSYEGTLTAGWLWNSLRFAVGRYAHGPHGAIEYDDGVWSNKQLVLGVRKLRNGTRLVGKLPDGRFEGAIGTTVGVFCGRGVPGEPAREGSLRRFNGAVEAVHDPGFMPWDEALEYARALRLGTPAEWRQWALSASRPRTMPRHPDEHYRDEWGGWSHWLRGE